jgi:GPH family glycoside/pentoside/hexuronide:cation symporter
MKTEKIIRPFGSRDKFGYMFGEFGNDFTFIFASIFLMIFYTKVLGISTSIVGMLFLVARCIDAFTDITMGRIVDKITPAKDGKSRAWIRRMCGPVAIASFLMYQSSLADASMTVKIIYMFVTYILWGCICYTAINIPYGSMASLLSEDPDDRASLSTFRSVGSTLANLIIGVGAPMLIYTTDAAGNQIVESGRFTAIAGLFSVCTIICYLLCYFMTTERVKFEPEPNVEKVSFLQTITTLLKNRALLGFVAAAVLMLLGAIFTQSINQFLFVDYFKNKGALSIMSLVGMVPIFILAPFIGPFTKKFGKKEIGSVGCIIGGLSSILLFFMQTSSVTTYMIINVIGNLGFGLFNLIVWAFVSDIIDDQELKTGKREDGTIYATYSFARKIGQALAGGLGGFALGIIGYNSSVQVQAKEVTNGIYNIATLVPGVMYIGVGLCLIFIYPLGKQKVEANIAALKERRGH